MKRFVLYFAAGMTGVLLAGCSGLMGNEIHVDENLAVNAKSGTKSPVSIRIADYVDGRNVGNPRKIGISQTRVSGMSGHDIVLDRDVTDVVIDSLHKRIDDIGMHVLPKDDAGAQFELSGVVKELKYDVKSRDYVSIKLESTLKEVATGKVVWAGEVEQKEDRFAGVSGNNKGDIADYLKKELGVVTSKTAEAIHAVLMATRPELFELTPGTKVINGVKNLVAPGVVSAVPAVSVPVVANDKLAAVNGVLVVSTEPARAKVYLDGVYHGMSPLRIEAAPGVHRVEVRLKGYKTASEKVAVRKGDSTELELALEQ